LSEGQAGPEITREQARRRERLWDTVVAAQAALLPSEAPALLWEPGLREERIAVLESLVPAALERAETCLRVLGVSHPEWYVGLPLDRLLESYLHEGYSGELVAMAIERVLDEPVGLAGAARWLVHSRGAERVPSHDAVRLVPIVSRWALSHPVARNRTETLEMLSLTRSGFVVPLLHEVLAGAFVPREIPEAQRELLHVFGDPETFYVEDDLPRGTSDRAYAALLLAHRGERGIRPRVLEMMQTAGPADFHALALAIEALDARS